MICRDTLLLAPGLDHGVPPAPRAAGEGGASACCLVVFRCIDLRGFRELNGLPHNSWDVFFDEESIGDAPEAIPGDLEGFWRVYRSYW